MQLTITNYEVNGFRFVDLISRSLINQSVEISWVFSPNSASVVYSGVVRRYDVGTDSIKLIVEDRDTILELSTFVGKRQSYEADDGHTDDLVMTLVLFSWLTRQDYFKQLTDVDVRTELYEEKIEELEDDISFFGFITDGSEEESTWDGNDRWYTENNDSYTY